ncbi:hypothetical protein D9M69_535380 [compost metagenome]
MKYQIEHTPATSWWHTNAVDSLSKTVFESEPHFTGLLNHDGKRIMRVNQPIGFVHHHARPAH